MIEQEILIEGKQFIKDLFSSKLEKGYTYHDFEHTLKVHDAALFLAEQENVPSDDLNSLLFAALFHDAGYVSGYEDHEARSIQISTEFLKDKKVPNVEIDKVNQLILSTTMPQNPQNLLAQILCDADLCMIGHPDFMDAGKKLRKEFALTRNMDLDDEGWLNTEIDFFSNHQYFTKTAQSLWQPQKEHNIHVLKEFYQDKNSKESKNPSKQGKKKSKKKKTKDSGRGIETMFRTTYRTHMELSSIADNKANILLSINALIISIVISALGPKLDSNMVLVMPTATLILVCIATIIFATLSTIPKITKGIFSEEDIKQKRANLLFFGNFYNMDIKQYQDGIQQMMNDRDFLYNGMTRDIYNLGVVLAKKYRYLRIAYNVFMYGLILSIMMFGVSMYLIVING